MHLENDSILTNICVFLQSDYGDHLQESMALNDIDHCICTLHGLIFFQQYKDLTRPCPEKVE